MVLHTNIIFVSGPYVCAILSMYRPGPIIRFTLPSLAYFQRLRIKWWETNGYIKIKLRFIGLALFCSLWIHTLCVSRDYTHVCITWFELYQPCRLVNKSWIFKALFHAACSHWNKRWKFCWFETTIIWNNVMRQLW